MSIRLNNQEFKRYDALSLTQLNIVIPQIQRLIDTERVTEIVEYQESYFKQSAQFNFIGNLTIACLNEIYYLIDGQHRYEAMKQLLAKQYKSFDIMVNIIAVSTQAAMKQLFDLVNKSVPAPNLPDTIDKDIPKNVLRHYVEKHTDLFTSARATRPKINRNSFEEGVAKIVETHKITSIEDMITIIDNQNKKYLGYNYLHFLSSKDQKNATQCNIVMKAHHKCQPTGILMFGLFKNDEWVDDIIAEITKTIAKNNPQVCDNSEPTEAIIQHNVKITKIKFAKSKIPKALRDSVWERDIGDSMKGKCKVCNTDVTFRNFQCGHIIAEKMGGSIALDNLMAICSGCNQSMGTQNLNEFKAKHFPNSITPPIATTSPIATTIPIKKSSTIRKL
jgi:5-methylcytosine-specific restriction endonuclease McrA